MICANKWGIAANCGRDDFSRIILKSSMRCFISSILRYSSSSLSKSHIHHRCLPFIKSSEPIKGFMNCSARGSLRIKSRLSSSDKISLPPSAGMFPKFIVGILGNNGAVLLSTKTVGALIRSGEMFSTFFELVPLNIIRFFISVELLTPTIITVTPALYFALFDHLKEV